MKTLLGKLRDIEPRGPRPRLELHFGRGDLDQLPPVHKDPLTLVIDGVPWSGTIGLKDGNDPYVHTQLRSGNTKRSCTDVFLGLDLAEKAVLQFRVTQPGVLELDVVLERGAWREGGRPGLPSTEGARPRRGAGARATRPVEPPRAPAESRFPLTNPVEVLRLAERYWTLISANEREEEQAFEKELPAFRRRMELDKEMFVRIARWKSVRKTPNYLANSEADVRSASRAAFVADSDPDALEALTRLNGVAVRTAPALLQWMMPHRYPILDVRVLGALGEHEPANYEIPKFYVRIADRIRHHADELGVDLRTLDRALWSWDKLQAKGQ